MEQAITNCEFAPENRELVLTAIMLPFPEILKAIPATSLTNFIISTQITNAILYESLDEILAFANVFRLDMGFLGRCSDLAEKLENIYKWMEYNMEKCKNGAWPLTVVLFLHNKVLNAYFEATVLKISEKLVSKKILEQM